MGSSPGMKATAIAEIILGETEPGGRLPDHLPASRRTAAGLLQPDSRPARRRYLTSREIRHSRFSGCTGYTTFEYGDPTITNVPESGIFTNQHVHAEIAYTNTGDRKGTEVVNSTSATS